MVHVWLEDDCGNAPRKTLLRDFNFALARGDTAFVLDWLSEKIVWRIVGESVAEGKSQVAESLTQMTASIPRELVIETIITHGTTAAANGTYTMEDGRRYAFCNVYRFAGSSKTAKIKSISSYVIPTGEEG